MCWNTAYLLPRTLYTLRDQGIDDWELLIIDDKSEDDVKAVVDQFPDLPIKYHRLEHDMGMRGNTFSLNYGIEHAVGDVMMWSTPEVMLPPGTLRAAYDTANCNKKLFVTIPSHGLSYDRQMLIDTVDWKTDIRNIDALIVGAAPDSIPSVWFYGNFYKDGRIDIGVRRTNYGNNQTVAVNRTLWNSTIGKFPYFLDYGSDDPWICEERKAKGYTDITLWDYASYHQWHMPLGYWMALGKAPNWNKFGHTTSNIMNDPRVSSGGTCKKWDRGSQEPYPQVTGYNGANKMARNLGLAKTGLQIVAYATDRQKAALLLKSAAINGYPSVVILGEGKPWSNFTDKFVALREFVRTADPNALIMFMDAYDTLVCGGPAKIEALYRQHFNNKVVFNAEVDCWPDKDVTDQYPPSNSPYKHLNAGVCIGPAGLIYELVKDVDPSSGNGSDQRIWTKLFLDNQQDVAVDTQCLIFQTLCKNKGLEFVDEKLHNVATDTYPLVIHANGDNSRMADYNIYTEEFCVNRTLDKWSEAYINTEECHRDIVDTFTKLVDDTPALKAHRDYVQAHKLGFGERAFHWMWKLIVDLMPSKFRFLEIGVFKGQIVSLVGLLAKETGRNAQITGIGDFEQFAQGSRKDRPYSKHNEKDTLDLCVQFDVPTDNITLIKGDSTTAEIHKRMNRRRFEVIYIDGNHTYDYVVSDIRFYSKLLVPGGLLVIDDSACSLKQPWGYFQGIQDVSRAVDDELKDWDNILTVMHNRVFRKKQ